MPPSRAHFTVEQYLAYDKLFEFRLEYHAGRILPVEIPASRHELILFNVRAEIRARLGGGAQMASLFANQRLRPAPNRYIYSDLALVFGAPHYTDARVDTLLAADAFIEISSPGGWEHDHVTKGELYRDLPGCREYWIIRTEDCKAEHWTRRSRSEWQIRFIEHDPSANFTLACAQIEFPLAHAYRGTGLAEQR